MGIDNEVTIIMCGKSQNEAFARMAVSAFIAPLDPTIEELTDVKTAVSEAVTNAIIHGYESGNGEVSMHCLLKDDLLTITVSDDGVGIDDIEEAMEPLFTSKPDLERSGMGFSIMQSFMDEIEVVSDKDRGTKIVMKKRMGK
jgi:stage II sporulation protein AB (anti-sigma F factor)